MCRREPASTRRASLQPRLRQPSRLARDPSYRRGEQPAAGRRQGPPGRGTGEPPPSQAGATSPRGGTASPSPLALPLRTACRAPGRPRAFHRRTAEGGGSFSFGTPPPPGQRGVEPCPPRGSARVDCRALPAPLPFPVAARLERQSVAGGGGRRLSPGSGKSPSRCGTEQIKC